VGGDGRFDYAVIEFSGCNDYPGYASGWKGIWVAPDWVITGRSIYMYGHPGDKWQPQIWGMGGGPGYGMLNGQYVDYRLDNWFGMSGSGLYQYWDDGWPYVVAVNRGYWGTFDSQNNYGRRITLDVYNFIVAYSAL
jgi:hypothetical protein